MDRLFGCKFTQLKYYEILLKLVNIWPSNHKNKKGELTFETQCTKSAVALEKLYTYMMSLPSRIRYWSQSKCRCVLLFVEPYAPRMFTVSPSSNTSLTVNVNYGYSRSVAQCSHFILTTSPVSSRRQVPCSATSVDLLSLSNNTEYQVTVVTVATYNRMSAPGGTKTVNAWTCKFFCHEFFCVIISHRWPLLYTASCIVESITFYSVTCSSAVRFD